MPLGEWMERRSEVKERRESPATATSMDGELREMKGDSVGSGWERSIREIARAGRGRARKSRLETRLEKTLTASWPSPAVRMR